MSHSRERSEKTCLNCNAQLHGRYCHICGQENTDPRESLWSIIIHFFNDITHFDGKFFKTAGSLMAKPGYLSLEFIRGRRANYLHPIRLYVFTSAVFFLIFYAFTSPELKTRSSDTSSTVSVGNYPGSFITEPLDTIVSISGREKPYTSLAQYDSVQKALPAEKRDNWITRKLMQRHIERRNKYAGENEMMLKGMLNNFIHSFPYLLFVSLPVSALFLQLLYFRNRNNVYAGHTIFLIYLYVFTFLTLLVYFGLDYLKTSYNLWWIKYIEFALIVYLGIYSLLAMKVYYSEGWGITIFKFIIFNILAFISILALFVLFILISLFKV